MNNNIYRVLDANVNRASEGIRVIEDVVRFIYNDKKLAMLLRVLRHELRDTLKDLDLSLIQERDSDNDVGKTISFESNNDNKETLNQLLISNFKRVQEALRVIEENLKVINEYENAKQIERLRFDAYTIERKTLRYHKKNITPGLYGITAQKYSNGKNNIDVVKEMIAGGIKTIQYREKTTEKSLKEIYMECLEIRKITDENDVLFIINDFIDIAIAVKADGVHIGQDDLPLPVVRKLVGDKMIIGLSTHSPEQAEEAINLGADYIGVGPIYKTETKVNVCDPVGLDYLEYAVNNINIPFVAIGGIKEHNINEILDKGAKTICLVTEIVGSDDIEEKVKTLNNIIKTK